MVFLSSLCRLTKVARVTGDRGDCDKKRMAAVLAAGFAISSVQIVLVKHSPPEGFIFYRGCLDPSGHSEIRGLFYTLKDTLGDFKPFATYIVLTFALQVVAIIATILTAIVIRQAYFCVTDHTRHYAQV